MSLRIRPGPACQRFAHPNKYKFMDLRLGSRLAGPQTAVPVQAAGGGLDPSDSETFWQPEVTRTVARNRLGVTVGVGVIQALRLWDSVSSRLLLEQT